MIHPTTIERSNLTLDFASEIMRPSTSSGGAEERLKLGHILQLYKIALGRAADADGLNAYFGQLRRGAPLVSIAGEFVASAEFNGKRPGGAIDSVAFALQLYSGAYGVAAADNAGRRLGRQLENSAGLGAKLATLIELAPLPADLPPDHRPEGWVHNDAAGYKLWSLWNDTISQADRDMIYQTAAAFVRRPLLSLIMFLDWTNAEWLDRTIASVRAQLYDRVELVIVGWPNWRCAAAIARHKKQDSRIRLIRCVPGAGRVKRLTLALEVLTGEMVGFIDPADTISETMAFEMAQALNISDAVSVIYADEDRIDDHGRCNDPWFKTDWDSDAMLAEDQIGRPVFVRTALMRKAAAQPDQLLTCWEYDLLLRASEGLGT